MNGAMVVPADAPHLGGYRAGGDAATTYPALWYWLIHTVGVRSVLDVGCGDGVALNYFRAAGCRVLGIDGVPQPNPDILQHDYTLGPAMPGARYMMQARDRYWRDGFDLVWSCEFVEHVEECYLPNVLDSFRRGRLVLMTHAQPGQQGHHHVNCRTPDYWTGVLAAAGFKLDQTLTYQARYHASVNPSPHNHFARSGLAFRRNP